MEDVPDALAEQSTLINALRSLDDAQSRSHGALQVGHAVGLHVSRLRQCMHA